eukprot:CAMPEP_0182942644 /NCGR_PEP_ID=MMETSP0105_2-20130417/51056_1 /TAXON_ID=81532 ORGANISM="Acanthoeca-like sp., Strain 10tr" /NCGR_SAMPLE_ID=MMETSP0105_2 /ASSEMBLY_ACC=CAM_ASM_000205 /LENGTH=68 /DNA_ID=CAMNT_0025082403 /DNA_START=28 /DNA_END=230 /DNA_ORIENTATION=-
MAAPRAMTAWMRTWYRSAPPARTLVGGTAGGSAILKSGARVAHCCAAMAPLAGAGHTAASTGAGGAAG